MSRALNRILNLPVLDPQWEAPDLSDQYLLPGAPPEYRLRPVQSKALYYAAVYGGFIGFIGVGHGKALITMLAGIACGAKSVLVLVPADTKQDWLAQRRKFSHIFKLHGNIHLRTYHWLSSPKNAQFLMHAKFDLVVLDEGHALKYDPTNPSSRTTRFLAFMGWDMRRPFEHWMPRTKLIVMSGTLSKRSIMDYWHLMVLSIRYHSPLPLALGFELDHFQGALDVTRGTRDEVDTEYLWPLRDKFNAETNREAYRRRLQSCPGVVTTVQSSGTARTVFKKLKPHMPQHAREAYDLAADTGMLPNGDELVFAFEIQSQLAMLSQGYYTHYVWPESGPDMVWIQRRRALGAAIRAYRQNPMPGLDSEYLILEYIRQNVRDFNQYPPNVNRELYRAWCQWEDVKGRGEPPRATVWIDYFMVQAAIDWAYAQPGPCLIWYSSVPVGTAIAEYGRLEFAGTGKKANQRLATGPATKLVLSIDAHHRGKNLQDRWYNQLVAGVYPSTGDKSEQLLGRTNRMGQLKPEIRVSWFAHTGVLQQALNSAKADSRYMEDCKGTHMLLNRAEFR